MSTTCTATVTLAEEAREPGLALRLPARLLDEEFGRGRVVRFEDVDFPAALTHEPTRRFLRETGLPEDGILFELDTDVPLHTLAEYYADEHPSVAQPVELPPQARHLIRLGDFADGNSLVVDGTTGEVWNWSAPEAALYPFDEDVSALAFSLWLLHRTLGGRGGNRTRPPRPAGLSEPVKA
ncbi:SUKH-4 family immunity protein [Streptomyces carpinensis]|uniref:SUKH-4 family immunity protein n=1 Tax=Streptomyces carpinensis TaxID=66369 RepID=A0ABV1WG48_9ACTN|nr:SUKH-4 family immunity protein [Streptomyces carpinensis]